MRTDVCQDGSGSVFGRSQMTPRSPLECCQTIGGTARLGMRQIQHLAMRKNLGNLSNGSCHSLGVLVSHTDFAFDAFNIQETAPTLLQCWFLNYCFWIVSDFSRERDVYFRICWGATSSWLFQEWKPKIKPLRFYFSFENQCLLNVLWIIFKQLKKNKCVWQMSHLSINLSTGQSSKQ